MRAQGQKPRENGDVQAPRGWSNIIVQCPRKKDRWCIEADVKGLLLRSTRRRRFIRVQEGWYEVSPSAAGNNVVYLGAASSTICRALAHIVTQYEKMHTTKTKKYPVPISTRERLKSSTKDRDKRL